MYRGWLTTKSVSFMQRYFDLPFVTGVLLISIMIQMIHQSEVLHCHDLEGCPMSCLSIGAGPSEGFLDRKGIHISERPPSAYFPNPRNVNPFVLCPKALWSVDTSPHPGVY